MAITGTGTAADPYRPETWEEILQCTTADYVYTVFPVKVSSTPTQDTTVKPWKKYFDASGNAISEPKTSEIKNYYENTFLVDLNDYYPNGIPTAGIYLKGFVDGNGATIKNAHYDGDAHAMIMSNADSKGKITYLNFTDFYFKATRRGATLIGVRTDAADNGTFSGEAFYGCQFSGTLSSTDVDYCAITQCGYTGYIKSCAYNVKAISRGCNLDTGNYVAQHRSCNIVYEAAYGAQMALVGCYVEGSAHELNIYSKSSQPSNTSILNFTADTITGTRTYQNMILVNTDRYSGTLPTGFIGVTDEQMKDAAYLSSIGFPIGVKK
jgi:hypothetical protein